jgi:predicted ATPase/DNA-binding SARP family transcriptional activator
VALLGAPEVISADGTHIFALPRKTLDVLAYLILHRGRTMTRASVAFALFPDDEEELARNSLRRNLSYLLSSLPTAPASTPFILTDGKTIAWNEGAPATIDVDEFERAIADERDAAAVAIYSGELLPTLYTDWTIAERERLRALFHDALFREVQRLRSLRRFDDATTFARTLLNDDPWREDVLRLLMAVRHEAGDRSGALAEFERFAARLRLEMRTDPMVETIAVRDAVLRGAALPTSERTRRARGDVTTEPELGLPFVGRDAAMNSALAAWHRAADGRGGLLVVAGEAGIGKSRFVTELARSIEREGGQVIRGHTSANAERQPYEAFVDALQQRPLDASLDLLFEKHASATLSDDRAARARLFESIRHDIAGLAKHRPLAVILEDLHWSGPDTIALLDSVAMRLGSAPVLIVVTMRTDELPLGNPLRRVIGQLQNRGSADEIDLQRLSARDATTALEAVVANADAALVAEAIRWADGVPLLLLEAARDVVAGRSATHADIGALVGDRFARLTPPAAAVLVYAAAAGSRFELATIAAAMGWANAAIVDALVEAVELGLVRAAGNVRGLAFIFGHQVLHAAAYERIEATDRARAHAMIARALAALPESVGSGAAEAARQFQAAGEPERAARFWRTAGTYALSVYANEDARAAATAGLALAGDDAALRYDLLLLREDALRRVGGASERQADSVALLECAGEDRDRECEALARVCQAHPRDTNVRRAALDRLAQLALLSDRYSAVYERTASRHAASNDDYAEARDAALRAAERFERLGDQREAVLARLHHIRMAQRLGDMVTVESAVAALRPVAEGTEDIALAVEFYFVASRAAMGIRYEPALADARHSLELALRIGDRYAEARVRVLVAQLIGRVQKNYAERDRELKAALAAYRDVGSADGIDTCIVIIGTLQMWRGDFEAGRRTLAELRTDARKIHIVSACIFRGYGDMWEGRLESAERELSAARELAARLNLPRYVAHANQLLAETYRLAGDPVRARRSLDAALDKLPAGDAAILLVDALALSARLHAESGNREAAQTDASAAEELAMRHTMQGFSLIAWHLSVAYSLLGDAASAERLARESARAFVDDALHMDAEAAECWSRLPWHREAIAFLSARNASGTASS